MPPQPLTGPFLVALAQTAAALASTGNGINEPRTKVIIWPHCAGLKIYYKTVTLFLYSKSIGAFNPELGASRLG